MNWKAKALMQQAVSRLPLSTKVNYLGQRVLMRRFGSVSRSVIDRFQKTRWFIETWEQCGSAPLSAVRHYEIGSGWHLAVPLTLWCYGVDHQVTADIARLARIELINQAIATLREVSTPMPRRPLRPIKDFRDLEEHYGIAYWAPCDTRHVALPDESVDWVTSTLTLQHIPVRALKAVLAESHRVLKPTGLFFAYVDYADNYAYTDRSISPYNFLQYTDNQWRWFNPPIHHQNRLRHIQYRRLFHETGLSIVAESANRGSERDLETVTRLKLAPQFCAFRAEDLAVRSARFAANRTAATPYHAARSQAAFPSSRMSGL